jgi:hypothetical protein
MRRDGICQVKHSGKVSLFAGQQVNGALAFGTNVPFKTKGYSALEFYIYGVDSDKQKLRVVLFDQTQNEIRRGFVNLDNKNYIEGGSLAMNEWRKVRIPLEKLKASDAVIAKITFDENTIIDLSDGTLNATLIEIKGKFTHHGGTLTCNTLKGVDSDKIGIAARGEMAVVALYSALLSGNCNSLILKNPPASQDMTSSPDARGPAIEMLRDMRSPHGTPPAALRDSAGQRPEQ